MIVEIYRKIIRGEKVRQNLIELKKLLKDDEQLFVLVDDESFDQEKIEVLLADEDPKVRKNAALILGLIGNQESLEPLYEAYVREDKLFVKSAYLEALKELDFRPLVGQFEDVLKVRFGTEYAVEDRKHIREEIRLLYEMVRGMDEAYGHYFDGYQVKSTVFLVTTKGAEEMVVKQLEEMGIRGRKAAGGVFTESEKLSQLLKIRTFKSMLFSPENCDRLPGEPEALAQALLDSGITEYLEERHSGSGPYTFRVQVNGRMDSYAKTDVAKRMAAALEDQSKYLLLNSTSDYEIEIRLIETRDGLFQVLVKMMLMRDRRFIYRKHALPVSLHPVNAAIAVRCASEWLQEDAYVLDPFCGTGTMLVERARFLKTGGMYGVDLFGEAVMLARENARLADLNIQFIQRDFFDFSHKHLFDEVITDLPRQSQKVGQSQIIQIYRQFFRKIRSHIKEGAILTLYTGEKQILAACIKENADFQLVSHLSLPAKDDRIIAILKYK